MAYLTEKSFWSIILSLISGIPMEMDWVMEMKLTPNSTLMSF
ncbi:MAG: hypothetical protein ACXQTS_01610 [Candidatus Methanospirareceae archaeon]